MATTRRHFLKTAAATPAMLAAQAPKSANDHIQVALIGAGGQGSEDARMSIGQHGVKLVAVSDCYDGRLERAREVFGKDVATTRDYREILARRDVDAVIIGTPDHWHRNISMEAMNAGKDVYCEKPMVQHIDDGKPVVEAWQKSNRIMQVGSQRVSSVFIRRPKGADCARRVRSAGQEPFDRPVPRRADARVPAVRLRRRPHASTSRHSGDESRPAPITGRQVLDRLLNRIDLVGWRPHLRRAFHTA